MKWLLLLAGLALGSAGSLQAQDGSWNPAGANAAYPRTLLRAEALAPVRTSLADPQRRALYASLWTDTQSAPPTDNSSSSGRRARATWAKNAAFVVLLGQQPAGNDLAALAPEQSAALVANVRNLLDSINTDVEPFATRSGTTPYTEWQWRSKELIDYLVAYDLLRGSGENPDSLAAGQTQLQTFAGNLYKQALTPLGPFTFFGNIKNNHTLMTAAALGTAAVVLSEATSTDANQQPANWAGAGLYNIDNVLWRDAQRQSDSTQVAGYAEGPYYAKYALLNCLPFFRTLGNFLPDGRQAYTFGGSTRSIRNPYYDPKYDLLYQWLTAIRMPDGRLPALEDSYVDMGMPELALTGKPQYVSPMYFSQWTGGTSMASALAQLRDVTVDMRAAYLAATVAPAAPTPPALTVLPGAGNLILRSAAGPDSLAAYLHLYGRGGLAQTNSGGHSQGDASSFILHAQGQLLALDPGYLSYNRRGEVGQATNHNLVLVDGAGPAIGSPGTASPAQSALGGSFALPQLSYGEVTTAYQGANLVRRALLVRGSYYLLADDVQATDAHTYTWQLHGYGLADGTAATGTFVDSLAAQAGIWQKNGVSLQAHVTATGGTATYSTATNPHETTYDTSENHTTLLVQSAQVARTQFLAALHPYTAQPPSVASTSQATTAALAATSADYVDVAFAQADSTQQTDASNRLPQPVSADGQLNFYSATASGDFAQLFMQQGTALNVGTALLLRASRRATVAWQRTSATHYEGYADRATTLTLALPTAPDTVAGASVASYAYDPAAQQLQVAMSSAGSFAVELATGAAPDPGSPLPVQLVSVAGQRRGAAVQLSWRTASELHSRGFEVQRRAALGEFATLGFVAGQGTTPQATDYAFCDSLAPATQAYYRLRLLDQDGTSTYSPVVAIAERPAGALFTAWPQPAHDWLLVQLAEPVASGLTLQLRDNLGRVVRQQAAQSQTRLSMAGLPPGLYYLLALAATGQPVAAPQKVLLAP